MKHKAFPKISLKAGNKATKSIKLWALVTKIFGEKLTGDAYNRLIDVATTAASTESLPVYRTTIETLGSSLLGQMATKENISFFAEFIGANIHEIQQNKVVMPATDDCEPGWCPLQIKDIKKNGDKIDLICQVVLGRCYGKKVIKTIDPIGLMANILYSRTGLTTRRKRNALPRELVGMYLWGLVTLHSNKGFTFGMCGNSAYLLAKNKELIGQRKKPCIRGFNIPCAKCHIGYSECPRGVRPVTLTLNMKELTPNDKLQIGSQGNTDQGNGGNVLAESTTGPGVQLS